MLDYLFIKPHILKYKYLLFLLAAVFILTACKTIKKTQEKETIIKGDNKHVAITSSHESAYMYAIQNKLNKDKIDFKTFTAKLSLSISNKKINQNASGNLRIEKDKHIWVSVTGPFGIEVFRALATPDSILIIDKLQNNAVRRSITYLQQLVKMPVDFYSLQDLLMGNGVLTHGTLASYKASGNVIEMLIKSAAYENLATLSRMPNNEAYEINSFKISEANSKRTSTIFYTGYTDVDDKHLSLKRDIQINDNNGQTRIQLQYRNVAFNQPVSFPVTVPRNFSSE